MNNICVRCVMDTSAPEIKFDDSGVCNFCKEHEIKISLTPSTKSNADDLLGTLIKKIKSRKSGAYDCIVGLSGGVDSSYVAYKATQLGLHPLAVHFDNGWNSELAVKNIERMVKKLNIDLITSVIDWGEFRDIQKSFFKANVVDIEMVTDHAIFASIYKIARENNIRYILSGANAATESIMPPSWQHLKSDLRNLKAIHKKYGVKKIKRYPTLSIWGMAWHHYITRLQSVSILNYISYSKGTAIKTLQEETGWQYYGGKHYESVFTKFYQAFILPQKFGIDKRKIHLSDLIMNREISRNDALNELDKPLYDKRDLAQDMEYVCKKLGFSKEEFKEYIHTPPKSHFDFPSYAKLATSLANIHKLIRYR